MPAGLGRRFVLRTQGDDPLAVDQEAEPALEAALMQDCVGKKEIHKASAVGSVRKEQDLIDVNQDLA